MVRSGMLCRAAYPAAVFGRDVLAEGAPAGAREVAVGEEQIREHVLRGARRKGNLAAVKLG